jgi:acylphosphatase
MARTLGLRGWVANRPDGSVEVLAEGAAPALAALLRWCHDGPPAARVDHIEVTDEPVHGTLPEPFTIH